MIGLEVLAEEMRRHGIDVALSEARGYDGESLVFMLPGGRELLLTPSISGRYMDEAYAEFEAIVKETQ